MNNRQITAIYEDLKKLAGNEIRTAGGNDLVTAWRLFEKMDALINLQYCAVNFRILLESTEDEESREHPLCPDHRSGGSDRDGRQRKGRQRRGGVPAGGNL